MTSRKRQSCLVLDIDMSHIAFQTIHHIAMDQGHPKVRKMADSISPPTNLDIASILKAEASGVRICAVLGPTPPTLQAQVDNVIGSLDISQDRRILIRSPTEAPSLELLVSSLSVKLAQRSSTMKLGAISARMGHQGPVWAAAASVAHSVTFSRLLEAIKTLQFRHVAAQRLVVDSILTASQQKAVIDPLSTIQPSYLVQTGAPHLLRNDISFRFLFHLRDCLRNRELPNRDAQQPDLGIDTAALAESVERRLALLDQDARSVDDLTAMDSLFIDPDPEGGETQTRPSGRPVDLIVLQIIQTKVIVDAPSGPSSELVFSKFIFTTQFKKQNLAQFNLNTQSNASQTSLRSKSSKVVHSMAILTSLGEVNLIVAPPLMDFAQQILRTKKQFGSGAEERPSTESEKGSIHPSGIVLTEIIGSVHHLQIQAAAENLILVLGIHGLRASSAMLAMQKKSLSGNTNILFDEVYLQARSPTNPSRASDQDILAVVAFSDGKSSVVSKSDLGSRTNLKVVFTLTSFKLHVPRSALRLYRFVEEWRSDYLPGIEATTKALLSEYKAAPQKPPPPSTSSISSHGPLIQIHTQVEHFEVSLQVMHGTWLSLEMNKTMAYVHNNTGALGLAYRYSFGAQVGSTVVKISSKPSPRDVTPNARVKLALPQLSIAGNSDGSHVTMLMVLEFLDLKVKPSHWDTLLAVQQKFGQDFNDLVALMQKTRQQVPKEPSQKKPQRFVYHARLKMQGFRIGLEGLSSTLFLECQDINGSYSSYVGGSWDFGLSGLALSLASRTRGRQTTTFNRSHRSAFVIIDFKMSGSTPNVPNVARSLKFTVSKIHAVMQPSSIGEFGDFIDNLQVNILILHIQLFLIELAL